MVVDGLGRRVAVYWRERDEAYCLHRILRPVGANAIVRSLSKSIDIQTTIRVCEPCIFDIFGNRKGSPSPTRINLDMHHRRICTIRVRAPYKSSDSNTWLRARAKFSTMRSKP